MVTYRLTDERRRELIEAHIEEFGTDGAYNERTLEALRRCPEVFTISLTTEDQSDLEARMHLGQSPASEDGDIVVLCDEYWMGHCTLEEV